jgi:hypothetical protein
MLEKGYLEPLEDFEHQGKTVLASRLGYRITDRFVREFLGKIFDNPASVFTADILQPERQGLEVFVDGVNNIVEAQQKVARQYLEDGSIEDACPPLKALINIMAHGEYQGMDAHSPEFRAMFTRNYLLESDWCAQSATVSQSGEPCRRSEAVGHRQPTHWRPGQIGASTEPGLSGEPGRHYWCRPAAAGPQQHTGAGV